MSHGRVGTLFGAPFHLGLIELCLIALYVLEISPREFAIRCEALKCFGYDKGPCEIPALVALFLRGQTFVKGFGLQYVPILTIMALHGVDWQFHNIKMQDHCVGCKV